MSKSKVKNKGENSGLLDERGKALLLQLVWKREAGHRLMELEQLIQISSLFKIDPWSVIHSASVIAPQFLSPEEVVNLNADIVQWLGRYPRDHMAKLLAGTLSWTSENDDGFRRGFRALIAQGKDLSAAEVQQW